MRLTTNQALGALGVIAGARRPRKLSDMTVRRILARRMRVLLIVVPVGLALSAWLAYHPDHAITRALLKFADVEPPEQ